MSGDSALDSRSCPVIVDVIRLLLVAKTSRIGRADEILDPHFIRGYDSHRLDGFFMCLGRRLA